MNEENQKEIILNKIKSHKHSQFGELTLVSEEEFEVYALGHLACPGTMFAPGVGYCPGGYTSGASQPCSTYGGTGWTTTYCIS